METRVIGRIRDVIDLSYIDFEYIDTELSIDSQPEYESVTILGRTSEIYGYNNTSGRKLQLTLYFNAKDDYKRDVFEKVMWLESLKYPEYAGNFMNPPHHVVLTIGKFICMRAVVENVNTQWKPPYHPDNMFPYAAQVELSLNELSATSYDHASIRDATSINIGIDTNTVRQVDVKIREDQEFIATLEAELGD